MYKYPNIDLFLLFVVFLSHYFHRFSKNSTIMTSLYAIEAYLN